MEKMKPDWIEESGTNVPVLPLQRDSFTPSSIPKSTDDEETVELIVDWFLHFFCDPADETPYNSKDGGYQYIYGGPYDLEEVLWRVFDGKTSEDNILQAIDEINTANDVWEWAPSPMHPDQIEASEDYKNYQENLYWWEDNHPMQIFRTEIRHIEEAVKVVRSNKIHEAFFLRMLFSQSFSVLEAFLFDQLRKLLSENRNALANFAKNDKFVSSISFTAEQILAGKADVEKAILGSVNGRVFHRFDRVLKDYKSATNEEIRGQDFLQSLEVLSGFLPKRHNCVHRNGVSIDGSDDSVSEPDISYFIFHARKVVEEIAAHCSRFW